jgi:hypothetical protein
MSTAPILNDFLADGSIDLTLSKPVSRLWVFLVKYVGSLLFVILQVAIFSLGVFLCVAWRLGEWRWSVFWAVPLITVFFSYLYCVNVLMTMLTRSTLASLLITFVFWGMLFLSGWVERKMNEAKFQSEVLAEMVEKRPAVFTPVPPAQRPDSNADERRKSPSSTHVIAAKRQQREATQRAKERHLETAASIEKWRSKTALVLAFLPKTKQTTDILDRKLIEPGKSFWQMMFGAAERSQPEQHGNAQVFNMATETERRMQEHYDSVSAWYILGTSLAFEAVVLGFACFLFYRRDF